MIKIAICDDEPCMIAEIVAKLAAYLEAQRPVAYQLETFADGRALLASETDFDLIFLDIQMAQPDGMATAKMLRRQRRHGLLVFVTVLRECVFAAFEVEAFDYLVKPLDDARFQRVLERAMRTLAQLAAKNIVIQRGKACEVVRLAQVVYFEVQGRKIYIHQKDGQVIDFYERLDDLAKRVDGRFFRCHRSYLVNLAYVRGCADGQLELATGGAVPVSRLRERDLRQALLRYMKEK